MAGDAGSAEDSFGVDCLIASSSSSTLQEVKPKLLKGYLNENELPNSLKLLPPPPRQETAAHAHDEEIARQSFRLSGQPRWRLAEADADLRFPRAAGTFSCALRVPISEATTPRLYTLLRRTLTDAGLSTYHAKNHYQRRRPFLVNQQPICSPHDADALTTDPSYPSGHTAVGWAWALILSELAPERSGALLARGLAYGESRYLCNVHWYSDVINGRAMGAATVALLHSNQAFRADMEAAKVEIQQAREKRFTPTPNCALEASALAQ